MKPSSERRQINGEWIKALRKSLALSQTVFAERVGVSLPSVARWELGTFRPSLLAARLLLEFADANRDALDSQAGKQEPPLTGLKRRQSQRSQRGSHATNERKPDQERAPGKRH
jgi:transcriptional regulator with XRE-family HTH domain